MKRKTITICLLKSSIAVTVQLSVTWCDLTVNVYTSSDNAGFNLHSLILSWPGMGSSMNLIEDLDDPGPKAVANQFLS